MLLCFSKLTIEERIMVLCFKNAGGGTQLGHCYHIYENTPKINSDLEKFQGGLVYGDRSEMGRGEGVKKSKQDHLR